MVKAKTARIGQHECMRTHFGRRVRVEQGEHANIGRCVPKTTQWTWIGHIGFSRTHKPSENANTNSLTYLASGRALSRGKNEGSLPHGTATSKLASYPCRGGTDFVVWGKLIFAVMAIAFGKQNREGLTW